MKGGKDEGKAMDPMFPRLHISDADKGGPKPPPRNKMALSKQYSEHSQSPVFNSGPTSIRPGNARSSFAPQASSSHVGCAQQKVLPTFLAEGFQPCYTAGVNLSTSVANSQPGNSEPKNYENSCHVKGPGGDENGFRIPSYLQPGPSQNHGNLKLQSSKESSFASVSSGKKLHSACLKLETSKPSEDNEGRAGKPLFNLSIREKISAHTALTPLARNKRCASEMDDTVRNNARAMTETTHECSDYNKNCRPVLPESNTEEKQESSDNSVTDSIPGLEVTPEDVVGVIGHKLFWKARKMILHQQRIFSMQIFELHRLVKVQKLISESPEVLHENDLNLKKPASMKFPPINKLLYVTPLEPSPVHTKPKPDPQKANLGKDHRAEANNHNNAEKGYLAPNAIPAPWCFNQWLIPVKSPSEGLIYKPYTGPCPPTAGIVGPVFGNCSPISLSPVNGTASGVPAPNQHGLARFSGQAYFQPYPMPLISPSVSNLEVEAHEPDPPDKHSLALSVRCQNSSDIASQHGPVEQLQGDGALSLFPTTPSFHGSEVQYNEQKVQVIKVVPHNPKSASESAARIFRSIQEGKNRT